MRTLLLWFVSLSFASAWELPSFLSQSFEFDESLTSPRELYVVNETMLAEAGDAYLRQLNATQEYEENGNQTNSTEYVVTDSPTESPAPSPSPSEMPTNHPTITARPTTLVPTESPAPSPSPSETPSIAPTISSPPTIAPTVSSAPSRVPSSSPSQYPSFVPTLSSQPSALPSGMPSTSTMPSSMPTLIREISDSFSVVFPVDFVLSTEQSQAFEVGTAKFLTEDVKLDRGKIDNVTVDLKHQFLFEAPSSQAATVNKKLNVNFTATVIYMGSDTFFDLHEIINKEFQKMNPHWILRLAQADSSFQFIFPNFDEMMKDLDPAAASSLQSPESSGMSNSGTAIVSTLCVVAITIAVVAALYAARHHKKTRYGTELGSPCMSVGTDGNVEVGPYRMEQIRSPSPKQKKDDEASVSSWVKKNGQSSPNSLELGASIPLDQIMKPNPPKFKINEPSRESLDHCNPWNHIQLKTNAESNRVDPPSAASEINFATTKISSLLDNNTEMSEYSRNNQTQDKNGTSDMRKIRSEQSSSYRNQNRELMLTRSMGGTLGAQPVDGSNAGSGFSGSSFGKSSAFFAGLTGMLSRKNEGNQLSNIESPENENNTLGARAVEPEEQAQLKEQSSYDSMSRRAGLYDVFAPAGPIGIIVDTTKNGPAVHSLKQTSPMLGLINPGDLIVALDDEDTRGMTAATLTRLMAQKSNQKERKITLLTTE